MVVRHEGRLEEQEPREADRGVLLALSVKVHRDHHDCSQTRRGQRGQHGQDVREPRQDDADRAEDLHDAVQYDELAGGILHPREPLLGRLVEERMHGARHEEDGSHDGLHDPEDDIQYINQQCLPLNPDWSDPSGTSLSLLFSQYWRLINHIK